MRCNIPWHPREGGAFKAVTVVAFLVGAVAVWLFPWYVAAMVAVAFVLVATLALASRLLVDRLSGTYWRPGMHNPARVRVDMRAVGRASLPVEAPAHVVAAAKALMPPRVIPGDVLGVSATDPLPLGQRTAGRQGTRGASR